MNASEKQKTNVPASCGDTTRGRYDILPALALWALVLQLVIGVLYCAVTAGA